MKKLDGPFLPPRGGQAKQLVIFLHGYGDSGAGLLPIGQEWAAGLPDAAFAAPNACDVCESWPEGYQWFRIFEPDGTIISRVDRAELIGAPAQALNAYIDAQLQKWGVAEDKLAVVGFSQGAMMAMYAMPRRKNPCAGVIGYSGMLLDPEGLKSENIVKMPVLAIHGAQDDVVPPGNLSIVDNGFTDAGFQIETVMRPGLGHSIDGFGLSRGLDFLRERFGL